MIPDFKTYLKESVWMDIHKRSTGEAERKEEDINLLDINSFHKYLCDRYEKTNDYFSDGYINLFPQSHIINIMLFENTEESRVYRVIIWDFNRKPYITIPRKPLFTQSDFFKKIEEKYTLVESGDNLSPLFTVKSKDRSDDSSNKFFVEVIDFLLDNIEPPFDPYLKRVDDVNESVWMDIHKRSNGEIERNEESVNLLDFQGLYDYVCSHYKSTVSEHITIGSKYIKVPVYSKNYRNKSFLLDPPKGRVVYFGDLSKDYRELYDKLSEKYDIVCTYDVNDRITYITPKEGDGNNVFCLDVIDTTLNFVEKPILTKVLGESIWMDIHKRSIGKLERKEDNINLLNVKGLCEYINSHYHIDGRNKVRIENNTLLVDILAVPMSRETRERYNFSMVGDATSVETLFYNFETHSISSSDDVENVFNYKLKNICKVKLEERSYVFTPKDGSEVNNAFFISLIDYIIDNMPHDILLIKRKDVSESVWMDIHKHSTGDVERKEDRLVGAVKNLVPVDLGGKCLWADRDLEIDGQTAFTYDDASQFIDGVNGWRLPTFTDIMNLDTRIMYNDYSFQDDELHITNKKTNGELVFSNKGPYPGLKGFYYFWHVDGGIRYGKASNFIKRDYNKCVVGSFGSSDPRYTFCIRLVKDKEVSESVWMDIHKHSTGDSERKEESIDLLDGNEFYEYLKDIYISKNPDRDIIQGPFMDNIITMPFRHDGIMYFNLYVVFEQGRKKIEKVSLPDRCLAWFEDIEDTFEVSGDSEEETRMLLFPKDNSELTNQFALTVIDYLFSHMEDKEVLFTKKIDESVWMDIHKHSTGDAERNEENVEFILNDFSLKELAKYLEETYSVYTFEHKIYGKVYSFPVIHVGFKDNKFANQGIGLSYGKADDGEGYIFIDNDIMKERNRHLIKILRKNYDIGIDYDTFGNGASDPAVAILPKDNNVDIDNRYFRDVIEFIIENTK